jgi:GntR family transcriptional regulator
VADNGLLSDITLRTGADVNTDLSQRIDRRSVVPFHVQLRELLEREIRSGRLTIGDRLPSEPVLSKCYHLSRTTVRQALSALEQQGVIRKEKGRGAFVSRPTPGSWLLQSVGGLFDEELSRYGLTVESTVVRSAVERLPDWAAQSLQLPRGTTGVTLERVRRIDGEIALYVVNHLAEPYADLLPEIRASSTTSLYRLLRERHGVSLVGSSRVLEAVGAPAVCASRLRVPRGAPVAFIQSVSWDEASAPTDCYRAWLRTDRLRISVETQSWESSTGRMVTHWFSGLPAGAAVPVSAR